MPHISYFQRYSQRENHATNNTLLMLRHVYQASPMKLESVLNEITDSDLSLGVIFEQQIRGTASVPDAVIRQQAVGIHIETKLGDALWVDQIGRHLKSISDKRTIGDTRILVGLTKEPIATDEQEKLRSMAEQAGVQFTSTTFGSLVEALNNACAEYEHKLRAIIEDFTSFLQEEKLLEERNRWMPIFPCGTSFEENIKHGVYYEPPSRNSKRNYRLIGIYRDKAVRAVGEIEAIIIHDNGKLSYDHGDPNANHLDRIKAVIRDTAYYELGSEPTRFYFVPKFFDTEIRKISSGGIMGMRYLDLTSLLQEEPKTDSSPETLASELRGKTFE